MRQGDSLVLMLSAVAALMLASRAIRSMRLSFKVKAAMASTWVVLIIAAAVVAAWWHR